jgi:tetraacyldisaccharide 4'-kinase
VRHAPRELLNSRGESSSLESIAGKRVAACCAIGNPAGFRHTLETLDANVIAWREFPDHHAFTRDDVESLGPRAAGAEMILCTRKDLVKLQVTTIGGIPLWSVGVELQFSVGQSDFEAALAGV